MKNEINTKNEKGLSQRNVSEVRRTTQQRTSQQRVNTTNATSSVMAARNTAQKRYTTAQSGSAQTRSGQAATVKQSTGEQSTVQQNIVRQSTVQQSTVRHNTTSCASTQSANVRKTSGTSSTSNRTVAKSTANTERGLQEVKATPKAVTRSEYPKSTSLQKNAVVRNDKTNTVSNAKNESRETGGSDEGGNTVISIVKAIVYIIFIIIISVFLALGMILVGNDVFAFVKSDEVVEVVIPEYATLDQVADILYENDIIKYPDIFKLFAVYKKDDGEFIAGTYSVNGMMNYETLLGEFKEKIVYSTVDVTIPEGYTTDEIIDLFVEQYGIGTREGFVDVIENYDFDYWFIDELEENGRMENRIYRLDGYLFPDTYQFYTSSSEVTVINKLLKRFSQIFTKEYRDQCAQFGYSVDEMITLASMIEREAASPSEFFLVSSVFHNRLNNKWNFPKLESDATVLYVLRHEAGEKVSLTADDLKYDTPYNTYLYEGLPPGPIANPSASAMLAALSPQTTNYYYFVANKGTTYFSETKAQHDAYINEFKNETEEQQTTGDVPNP